MGLKTDACAVRYRIPPRLLCGAELERFNYSKNGAVNKDPQIAPNPIPLRLLLLRLVPLLKTSMRRALEIVRTHPSLQSVGPRGFKPSACLSISIVHASISPAPLTSQKTQFPQFLCKCTFFRGVKLSFLTPRSVSESSRLRLLLCGSRTTGTTRSREIGIRGARQANVRAFPPRVRCCLVPIRPEAVSSSPFPVSLSGFC